MANTEHSREKRKMGEQTKAVHAQSEIDHELEELLKSHRTVIKVFGTGGAGNNTVTRLMQVGIDGVETYSVNTDAQDLLYAQSHKKVLIGRNITGGLGAGSDPKVGEDAARENQDELKTLMANTDLVFVTCGLGGGTGTGSAPILAELARSAGALTISVVTLPFTEEGILRWNNAQYGLDRLKKNSDTLIVIQNDKLWEIAPDVPLDQAFKVADEILVNAVKGITELVTQKGLVNLDFADIRTIMKDGGTALIGMAESDSPDRSIEAVEKAIENPLIDLDITGARSALLNITGGPDMTIKDAKIAMQTLARKLDESAKIIWGASINPDLESKVRVMIIATGLQEDASEKLFRSERQKKVRPAPKVSSQREVISVAEDKETVEETPKQSGSESDQGEARKIFREIMEDESDADLTTFRNIFAELEETPAERDKWEALRQACTSLAGTAQMFDFDEIAEIMSAAEDLMGLIMQKDLLFHEALYLFAEVPEKIPALIRGESAAETWAVEFLDRLKKLIDYLNSRDVVPVDAFLERLKQISPEAVSSPGTREEKEEPETAPSDNGKNKKGASSVGNAVKFVNDLLKGDSKPSS